MEKNGLKCFKSPEMNFEVNLFFHLYETHITSLGIHIPTVPRVSNSDELGSI